MDYLTFCPTHVQKFIMHTFDRELGNHHFVQKNPHVPIWPKKETLLSKNLKTRHICPTFLAQPLPGL